MSVADKPRRGRGRPSGGSGGEDTAALIVGAARAEFAAQGYDGASMRGIARAAGVDPALVHHYFKGKEALFVAAMQLPFNPADVLPTVLAGAAGPDEVADRMIRFIFSIWRDADTRAPFLGLLRSATNSEIGAEMMRSFISTALFARVAEHLPPAPDLGLRINLAAAHIVGVALMRYVVRVEPLASAPEDEVIARVTPAIRGYFSGAGPG
ncbi:TetR family transcriptional regulator [Sporichthya sp.]|uniref:TetR/AcrR family transcriptional regulator n=1 Tax=Sporichthya sp. TaxID=65475 RepID=UPI00179B458D|nr:TetR family transcriptional regulator [Sporichthya sp.]MBA3742153.1 TetR/AcrR family transcriptional regulator [Sporichthya sp.]